MSLSPNRGRGECRVPAAPAASCAKCGNAHECRHHRSTGTPGIPARNGFTAYFVLSPATNSSCHRRWRIKVCLSPVGPTPLHQFNTSNGCQDHTALPSATTSFVCAPLITHGSFANPPCDHVHAPDATASTASHPASVTIAIRPSGGRDGEAYRSDLGQAGTEIFLQMGLDSRMTDLPVGQISTGPFAMAEFVRVISRLPFQSLNGLSRSCWCSAIASALAASLATYVSLCVTPSGTAKIFFCPLRKRSVTPQQ